MSLLWPESARKPNVEPMRGNGHSVRLPPRRVNNLASVVRVVTAFRSPNVTAKTAAERGPLPAAPSLRFSVLVNRRSVADSRRQFAGCFLRRSVNGGIASNGRISMATFAPGDDVDAYCGEFRDRKSRDLSFGYLRRKYEGSEAGQVRF
jgi:hypothetical protein